MGTSAVCHVRQCRIITAILPRPYWYPLSGLSPDSGQAVTGALASNRLSSSGNRTGRNIQTFKTRIRRSRSPITANLVFTMSCTATASDLQQYFAQVSIHSRRTWLGQEVMPASTIWRARRLSHLARRLRATFKVGEDLPVQKFPSRMGKPRCC